MQIFLLNYAKNLVYCDKNDVGALAIIMSAENKVRIAHDQFLKS
jgi:hypothetical protein